MDIDYYRLQYHIVPPSNQRHPRRIPPVYMTHVLSLANNGTWQLWVHSKFISVSLVSAASSVMCTTATVTEALDNIEKLSKWLVVHHVMHWKYTMPLLIVYLPRMACCYFKAYITVTVQCLYCQQWFVATIVPSLRKGCVRRMTR